MNNNPGNSFDPCECFSFTHLNSMRRLLEMLRDGQSQCNDIECFTQDLPNQPSWLSPSTLIVTIWMLLMGVAFLYWSQNRSKQPNKTNSTPRPDRDHQDPGPAPSVN